MTLDELNEIVRNGDIDETIRVAEARQCKELARIADIICEKKDVRLVLLAGASSAGKTTTAKRLATQIRVNELEACYLSTDDYFVGNSRNPKDESGDYDYETIECVDTERLTSNIANLLEGKAIHARKFDFVQHEGFDDEALTSLPKKGIVILEGLHALNPRLVEGLDHIGQFRIFIEPKTQPEIFIRTRLNPNDARLLRRLVRDHQFRKMTPEDTFARWPKVLAGEEKWINPFRHLANLEFDSSLCYELAVLKPYAAGLLEMMRLQHPEETKARFLADLLSIVEETNPTKVPGDSILRETIGGSQLDY
ncbi:MAG: nucleoside kinase [Kiritimatiellae bacterium]|nr:nucleoside kinase [Kiritimatiellia bacterium]